MVHKAARIGIALSGDASSFWRAPLARRLREDGFDVGFFVGPRDPEPAGLRLLREFERLVFRAGRPAEAERPRPSQPEEFDLLIAGESGGGAGRAPRLVLSCCGMAAAEGAVRSVLEGVSPVLRASLHQPGQESGLVLAVARAALEEPHVFARSWDRIAGRLGVIGSLAARRFFAGRFEEAPDLEAGAALRPRSSGRFFGASVAERIAERLTRLAGRGERWRVAWRQAAGDEVSRRGAWSAFRFRDLPDDGRRYYADPFAFAHQGRAYVLCEEFPYATGRGLISVVEIVEGRALGPPRPAIEAETHLSYPMTFSRDGAVWMIPESSAARRIELWRSQDFPQGWTREAVLVEGVAASDATILERDGRLWLFATVAEGEDSSWDALHLWSASRLHGPWTPHPANPVLIDSACARPAGLPFERGGATIRPVQDCSRFYGGGVSLYAIDRLDDEIFRQSLCRRLELPPGAAGARGCHTVNAAANLEVIDLFGPSPRRSADAAAPRR